MQEPPKTRSVQMRNASASEASTSDVLFGILDPTLESVTDDPMLGQDLNGVTTVRVIADGGMGRVYEGLQAKPRRAVAVKVMRPGFFSADARRRFDNEADILGRLHHPHIAQIYFAGIHELQGVAIPYFVMEYARDALPLTIYAEKNALSLDQLLSLFQKVCDAVAHGHEQGVVHRDLKPSNILVGPTGSPKVIDFGISRCLTTPADQMTSATGSSQLIGTVKYMSPEHFSGSSATLDERTDVYALGVVLYELVSGKPPYRIEADRIFDAAETIRTTAPAPLPELTPGLARIVEKCLQKSPQDRFANAGELAKAIDACRPSRGESGLGDDLRRARPATSSVNLPRPSLGVLAVCLIGLLTAGGALLIQANRRQGQRLADGVDAVVSPNSIPLNRYPIETLATTMSADVRVDLLPIENCVGMKLLKVRPGGFRDTRTTGSGTSVREVHITNPFYLGITEVTCSQWRRVMELPLDATMQPDLPVVEVSWIEATEFCKRLSALPEEKLAGRTYRLPTEAEWEFACHADGIPTDAASNYQWSNKNSALKRQAVGRLKPNAWGFHDMRGNVWEWCLDGDAPLLSGTFTNPVGSEQASHKVVRGGSWGNAAGWWPPLRAREVASKRSPTVGFRVAATVNGSEEPSDGEAGTTVDEPRTR